MKNGRAKHHEIGEPPARARFRRSGAAIWLPVSILLGLAIGWIATQVGMRFAPLAVFPLAVGVVLGVCLVGMTRLLQTGHRVTVFLAMMLAVLVAAGSQHYFSYLDARRLIEEDNRRVQQSPSALKAQAAFAELINDRLPQGPIDYMCRQASIGRPMPFGYVARGPMAWISWFFDGLLILLAAIAVVWFGCRQSFCDGCMSWYCTIRSGHLSPRQAKRLAELTGFDIPDGSTSPRDMHYSLSGCRGGCGPEQLCVTWQLSERGTCTATVWLDNDKKKQVSEIIDQDGD
ncbi:MAG: hypothetical protein JXM70_04265 [Pirellulales bacterium]|nr:hypothetical protein [Pirellulales bacterium]